MEPRRLQAIVRQRDLGMVEMKPTGEWGLTAAGRHFLDDISLLTELDDRPGTRGSDEENPRAPGRSGRDGGSRKGDDYRAGRPAARKGSR